jgi:DNA-binding NtrC family response regulator
MLTGHATIDSSIEGLNTSAWDYVIKPCPIEIIISAIENARERKAIARELNANNDLSLP